MTGLIVPLLLASLICQHIDAFIPGSFQRNTILPYVRPQTFLRMSAMDENDLTIPYDAAARKAYDEWRAQYNKGHFDEARYASFKANYEAITVANVVSKKESRDSGAASPRLLTLNEFGDYTAEEYESMQVGSAESTATSSSDVFGKAVEAAQSQAGAASALMEAADALAEEEEKLALLLGLESIEELEAAVDALEGIDEEGVQETDNLAREARIRSAYLEWCKANGKEPVESRFSTFSSNFLAMEKFAQSSGKEMVLNQFADATQEEYLALISAPVSAPTPAANALMETAVSGDVADDADVLAALKAVAEAEQAAEASANQDTSQRDALKEAADAKAEAAAQARLELAEKKKAEIAARQALASLSQEKLRELTETERKERQIAQEKAAEELRKANEAAAIAIVKEQAAKEAAQVAKRQQFELEAAEQARQQAREWNVRQEKLRARSAPSPSPQPKPKINSVFESLVPKASPKEPEKKSAGLELEIDLSSVFKSPEPSKKAAPAPAFNLFPSPKAGQVPRPKATAKVAPVISQNAPSKPTTPPNDVGFSFFGNLAPKAAPKVTPKSASVTKIAPSPVPKPAAKSAPAPLFSLFNSPSPTPSAKVNPLPSPKPASTPKSFAFFGSSQKPVPAPKAPKVAPTPAPKSEPQPFSFFGSPKPSPVPKVAPLPTPAPKAGFSFFGAPPSSSTIAVAKKSTSTTPQSKAKRAPATPPRRSGTIALQKANPAKAAGGISFFGGGGAKNDSIPVLSKFKQNKDGSLTGIVSNANGFKAGTKITTSPVRMGAKSGQVVTTASGSKYRLE